MNIVVVPGMHSPQLTDEFIKALKPLLDKAWVVPSQYVPVYSPQHVFTFIHQQYVQNYAQNDIRQSSQIMFGSSQLSPEINDGSRSLLFIGFSAGVVGSLGAARQWHAQGGDVKALIAVDGWGVPLYGHFPIHRVSHDAWTHWSSECLSNREDSFYADPPVSHLDLWRSPHTTTGIGTEMNIAKRTKDRKNGQRTETAAAFVRTHLKYYSR